LRHPNFKDYGGRGIRFLYADFPAFLADLGLKPRAVLTLDRRNNDGNYAPGNCRWATWSEQMRNQRHRSTQTCVCQARASAPAGHVRERGLCQLRSPAGRIRVAFHRRDLGACRCRSPPRRARAAGEGARWRGMVGLRGHVNTCPSDALSVKAISAHPATKSCDHATARGAWRSPPAARSAASSRRVSAL